MVNFYRLKIPCPDLAIVFVNEHFCTFKHLVNIFYYMFLILKRYIK